MLAQMVAVQARNVESAFQSWVNNMILQWGSERADLLAQIAGLQAQNVALTQGASEREYLLAELKRAKALCAYRKARLMGLQRAIIWNRKKM